ncbi:hypothetical protein B9Z65_2460 [Elsinoe australis]|uniref:Zinc finger PHD-type domain-containing protein n=1 Tax=Elsinoe australis TaxID=40998 RepID=A0A2P7ZAT5_9PEZI|nr:hypothetical protein B9Z65_2460 [Elsinoe australis]
MPRKRARDESELDLSLFQDEKPKDEGMLRRLRNMWQFVNFMQYLNIFRKAVKVEEFNIDEFEEMCLNTEKQGKLADIGLALLKYVSSHRGLTPQIFDEYTRRQYTAKAPERNPFGDEEEPLKFAELDIFTKIKVLQQLSVWTLGNADRIRSVMDETDAGQLLWRIEPFGWDADDRTYFVLDDDRLYRRTDVPIPPTSTKPEAKPKPKGKSKPKSKPRSKPTRSSKRIKLSTLEAESEDEAEQEDETEVNGDDTAQADAPQPGEDDGFGGMKWECVAVTMDEYQDFLESIRRSRDSNEKTLHKQIVNNVIPILEERAEDRRRELLKKQRDWENEQKLMTAKRSSRIAGKMEKQKEEEEVRAAEAKRRADLEMAHKEQQKQQKMEEASYHINVPSTPVTNNSQDRNSRMQTREQRLKEREVKRILHEEELAKLEERKARGEDDESRHSSRNLENEMERRQRELDELKEEEDNWVFDCSGCGLYGENIDDGTHSIACERCNIWQHSKCNGVKEADAEREDFHFICSDCKRKEEDAKKPKIPPLKLGRVGASSSPQTDKSESRPASSGVNGLGPTPGGRIVEGVSIIKRQPSTTHSPQSARVLNLDNGPSLSPHGQLPGPPGYHLHGPPAVGTPQAAWQGTALPLPTGQAAPVHPHTQNGQNGDRAQEGSSHYQIHQQAHASALANSGLHHNSPGPQVNGYSMTQAPMFPPPQQQQYRQPPPQSSYMNTFSTHRPSSSTSNGVTPSPVKKRATPSPSAPRHVDRNSPFSAQRPSGQSPYHQLSPPPNSAQQQRLAGQSPVKQVSPSPPPPYRYQAPLQSSPSMPPPMAALQSSPSLPPLAATPAAQIAPPASSPAASLLRATPQAASSPIPPVGDGPVIPQKHDTARPPSRDHVSETPVFPPATALSPSRTQDGKGMGTQAGEGGLGTGNVPVKKIPESPVPHAAQPVEGVHAVVPGEAAGEGGESNGHA